jgi:hypothetical protein
VAVDFGVGPGCFSYAVGPERLHSSVSLHDAMILGTEYGLEALFSFFVLPALVCLCAIVPLVRSLVSKCSLWWMVSAAVPIVSGAVAILGSSEKLNGWLLTFYVLPGVLGVCALLIMLWRQFSKPRTRRNEENA